MGDYIQFLHRNSPWKEREEEASLRRKEVRSRRARDGFWAVSPRNAGYTGTVIL